MTKFRIIERDGGFYVQERVLCFWITVEEDLGWNCSAPKPQPSMEAARAYIGDLMRSRVTVQYGG